jgi:hypothetical protein
MRLTQRFMFAAVAAAVTVCSAPAAAHGYNGYAGSTFSPESTRTYTGAWPVTISHSQFSNGTGCLTLTGTPSGGTASLEFGGQKYPYGEFLVMNGILVANITEPLYGQNGALMFVAHASRGKIGDGAFENIEGGSNFDSGDLVFGTKNGC